MTASGISSEAPDRADAVRDLCQMLLEIAGRDTNRLPSVIRHVRILESAIRYMAPAQKDEAIARIDRLQTKWGCLLPEAEKEAETSAIPPEMRIAGWLAKRRQPERLLRIMHLSAKAILEGETMLSIIMDRGYQFEDDGIMRWVGYDSFKEWLLQTRVAGREAKGIYRPGPLCRWWADEMTPSRDRNSAYAACLKLMWQHHDKNIRRKNAQVTVAEVSWPKTPLIHL